MHVLEDTLQKLVADPNGKFSLIACEVIVLQIRMICETLLLGSTLAHIYEGKTDLPDNKWRPKHTFQELAKVSPHPLQVPVEIELHKHGEGQHHTNPISQPIDFGILNRIYGVCGDLLHVPTPRQVGSGKLPEYDLAQLQQWADGFKRLAMGHALMLPDLQIILLMIWTGNIDDSPEVFRLDADGDVCVDMSKYPAFSLLS